MKAEVGGTLSNLVLHVVQPQAQELRDQNKSAPSLGPLGNYPPHPNPHPAAPPPHLHWAYL